MKRWRVTRPSLYKDAVDPSNVSCRQGYYVEAETAPLATAAEEVAGFWPEPLDVQDWNHGDDHGKVMYRRGGGA